MSDWEACRVRTSSTRTKDEKRDDATLSHPNDEQALRAVQSSSLGIVDAISPIFLVAQQSRSRRDWVTSTNPHLRDLASSVGAVGDARSLVT